jgi:hypothetical protein
MLSTRYSFPILMQLVFSRQFLTNIQISDFMKILTVGAKFFHAEIRTEGQAVRLYCEAVL